jgi:hypothetical protein
VLPGEWLEIEVRWTAQLPSVSHRTGFAKSFHMVAQWFPKLAVLEPDGSWSHFPFHRLSEFYADYGDYDVTIEAPRDFVIGATGALVEEAADGERMRWRYRQDDVHDFAFTAWDGFAVAERDGPGGVKLRCLYPRGEDALGALELDMVVLGLERYGEAYGPYPYGTLTVVHPPTGASDAGGMEYPTLITTGGSWWHPWLGFRSIEGVTLHELGHQWFYGMVGSNEYRWAFLDEGLTTWATQRVMRDAFGLGSAFDGLGLTIDQASFQRAHAAGAAAIGPIAQRADAFARGSDYGKLAYSRTSTLLETLRRVWGAADLDAAIGSYARAQRFAHPTPEDLIDAVRSGVGEAAASALADGLDGGWVDFEVASLDNGANDAPQGIFGRPDAPDAAPEAEGGARRALVVIRRRGTLRFPVEIELTSAGGQERRTWDGEGDHHTIVWTGDTDLTSVVIDPDERVLIDQDLSNNVARASRQRVAPRTLSLLAYVAGLVMALVAP